MSILFLIASLGVINGIIVSVFLLTKKQRTVPEMYFASLLLVFSIRIGKSIYFYFNESVDFTILQIGLSACIFIGPLFYLYMKSLFRYEETFKRTDIILIAILLLLIIGVGLVYPYQQFPEIWNGYIIYGIYTIWFVFTVAGLSFVFQMIKPRANSRWSNNQRYVLIIAIAMVFITLTYLNALLIGYTYIWGAFIFTFSFYLLAVRMFTSSKPLLPKKPAQELPNAQELLLRVEDAMKQKKLFGNKSLRLEDLAREAAIPRHTLSQVLNEAYPHGFSHYVKKYRVDEAKVLIMTRPELSLEGVGYEAGFNSKSAFFEAFKNFTGYTPAAYKNSQLKAIK